MKHAALMRLAIVRALMSGKGDMVGSGCLV